MSATWSFVEQCQRWTILAYTWCRIKWYFVLMCLVRSCNLGFLASLIAEVLSINNRVEFSCFSWKYSTIFLSHTISFIASTAATYSASVVESARTNYLRDLHETAVDPRLIVYPEFDTPVSLSPSKYESEYPISLKSSTLEYLSPTSWVPFKYLRTLFAADQCPSQGYAWTLKVCQQHKKYLI